jgi:hypothetical protein
VLPTGVSQDVEQEFTADFFDRFGFSMLTMTQARMCLIQTIPIKWVCVSNQDSWLAETPQNPLACWIDVLEHVVNSVWVINQSLGCSGQWVEMNDGLIQ